MKVMHVITRLILGGAQQTALRLCEELVDRGHTVTLVYGPIFGPEGTLLGRAEASGATLVELPTLHREVAPLTDWRCARGLRRLIHETKPDVVHTHSSKAGILGRYAAWKEGVALVTHTVHGLPWHDRQSAWKNRMFQALEHEAAKHCHRLIAVTRQMRDEFVRLGIAPLEKFEVIPSGIDIERFHAAPGTRERTRAELGIPPDAPVLGIVARLDPLKGHDDLLDVFPRLQQRLPELRMLWVGDGWDRERLDRRIAEAGLGDRVIRSGVVDEEAVPPLLRAMDVKALPSYQEGQSRTLPEALLCGCGVVAYDAGGIGSIVKDGETGRLVPRGDKAALAEAIAWMIEHDDERKRLVDAGREQVCNRFSSRAMLDAHADLYRGST